MFSPEQAGTDAGPWSRATARAAGPVMRQPALVAEQSGEQQADLGASSRSPEVEVGTHVHEPVKKTSGSRPISPGIVLGGEVREGWVVSPGRIR
jgi:hypothetical protein